MKNGAQAREPLNERNEPDEDLVENLHIACFPFLALNVTAGVVPVSSLSSVVEHADTTSLVFSMESKPSSACLDLDNGQATTLRLTWKPPAQVSATDVS